MRSPLSIVPFVEFSSATSNSPSSTKNVVLTRESPVSSSITLASSVRPIDNSLSTVTVFDSYGPVMWSLNRTKTSVVMVLFRHFF